MGPFSKRNGISFGSFNGYETRNSTKVRKVKAGSKALSLMLGVHGTFEESASGGISHVCRTGSVVWKSR